MILSSERVLAALLAERLCRPAADAPAAAGTPACPPLAAYAARAVFVAIGDGLEAQARGETAADGAPNEPEGVEAAVLEEITLGMLSRVD